MPSRIGTLTEKSLHAALKQHYAQPGDLLESRLHGYFIDILRPPLSAGKPPLCIEIQTRHLAAMKPKLAVLLDQHPVRVVHPIAQERHIIRIDRDGVIQNRRKSPKRGAIYHIFPELVSLVPLLVHPNLSIEIAFIHDEEVWIDDGQGSWRRKRWSIHDRHLLAVTGTHLLAVRADYAALIPSNLPTEFDTGELARAIRQQRTLAQKMAYCLRELGLIQVVGKRGRGLLYRATQDRT
ncbi:MAG: hypothetical protein L6Q98_09840 [Anaerolineae bacterium]|nr:hypothetical protein [Anaerolineae bacterium]NUQ03100.1 hypothetical protein [Anaerolineae bacterium]